MRPSEDMSSVSLDTLQVAQDLLLYLHDQDGGDPPDLGDLVLVDLVEDLVVQRQDVLQLVIRYPGLDNRKYFSPMKGWKIYLRYLGSGDVGEGMLDKDRTELFLKFLKDKLDTRLDRAGEKIWN